MRVAGTGLLGGAVSTVGCLVRWYAGQYRRYDAVFLRFVSFPIWIRADIQRYSQSGYLRVLVMALGGEVVKSQRVFLNARRLNWQARGLIGLIPS